MRSSRSSFASLAAIAALAFGAGAVVEASAAPASPKAMLSSRVPAMPSLSAIFGRAGGPRHTPRRPGPGWTHAHAQRLARKRRNQARHRRACNRRSKA